MDKGFQLFFRSENFENENMIVHIHIGTHKRLMADFTEQY
jgi:hypothetical protein